MIGKEEKFLATKKKRAEKNVKNLKLYLYDCLKLTNKQKIETDLFKFSIQKNQPALMIEDEKNIPEEFFYNEKILDKTLLKEKLKGYSGAIYKIDARKISMETLGRYFPNTPMLAAIVKVSGIMTDKELLNDMEGSFKHKFAKKPEVIEGNMKALKMALQEVKEI